jgi:hypothetical protein
MKWSDFLNEQTPGELKSKVLHQAQDELTKLRREHHFARRRRFLQIFALGGSVAAACAAIWMRRQMEFSPAIIARDKDEIDEQSLAQEFVQDQISGDDFEVIADLDLIEDIETLQDWDGSTEDDDG